MQQQLRTGPVTGGIAAPAARPASRARPAPSLAESAARAFDGAFSQIAPMLAPQDDPREALDCGELLDGGLAPALKRFAEARGEALTPALASIWSQSYLASITLPLLALAISGERSVPVSPSGLRLRLNENGLPVALTVPDDAQSRDPRFERLLFCHLVPFIRAMRAAGGPADRVIWGNAAHYIEWAVEYVLPKGSVPKGRAAGALSIVNAAVFPDGRANPLYGAIRYLPTGPRDCDLADLAPKGCRLRRTCCLRYMVDGVPDCGDLCPRSRREAAPKRRARES